MTTDHTHPRLRVTTLYEIIRYAADGHAGEPGDGACVQVAETLDEARAWIRDRIGGDYGRWTPDPNPDGPDSNREAWHESADYGCGGYVIRSTAGVERCRRIS
jgi:hypothetical protein